VALVVAFACLVGAGVFVWLALRPVEGALTDLSGNQVVLDEEPDVAAADPAPLPQGDDGVGRFQAPAQGLDVPLVAMNVVRGVINPPGNAFFEMGATESPVVVAAGDTLRVDGVDYTVTRGGSLC
jgi:hypothetical protein